MREEVSTNLCDGHQGLKVLSSQSNRDNYNLPDCLWWTVQSAVANPKQKSESTDVRVTPPIKCRTPNDSTVLECREENTDFRESTLWPPSTSQTIHNVFGRHRRTHTLISISAILPHVSKDLANLMLVSISYGQQKTSDISTEPSIRYCIYTTLVLPVQVARLPCSHKNTTSQPFSVSTTTEHISHRTPLTMTISSTPLPASQAPFPSFTSLWHQTSYPSISPLKPANSALNKTVLITGGGGSIGRATAISFAAAGAKHIAIMGRTESKLLQTKQDIETQQKSHDTQPTVWIYTIDCNDQPSVDAAISSWNDSLKGQLKIDVLVFNAGYCDYHDPIATTPAERWMKGITGNLYGPLIMTQAFLKYANTTPEPGHQTTVINIASLASFILIMPGISAYSASKQAAVTLMGCLQLEHPELRVVSVQPGAPDSELQQRAGVAPMDDGEFFCSSSLLLEKLLISVNSVFTC